MFLWLVSFLGGKEIMNIYTKTKRGFDLLIEKEFYEREAVYAVAYKYENTMGITFSSAEGNKIRISLFEKNGYSPTEKDVNNILADLLDEQFRLEILKRTGQVRDIIYQKAFLPLQEIKK